MLGTTILVEVNQVSHYTVERNSLHQSMYFKTRLSQVIHILNLTQLIVKLLSVPLACSTNNEEKRIRVFQIVTIF